MEGKNVRRSGRLRHDNQIKTEVNIKEQVPTRKSKPPAAKNGGGSAKRSRTTPEQIVAQPTTKPSDIDQPNLKDKRIFNVLIGITGSVATIKLIELVKKLNSSFPTRIESSDLEDDCQLKIKIIMTHNSQHFLTKQRIIDELKEYNNIDGVYTDADEWSGWKDMGDPVLHIELRKWAHLFVIAPLDANTMAKMSIGMCDNLLTCVVRAWDLDKPLLFCPAMNCHMYEHPVTKEHLDKLASYGYSCIGPVEKRLACGDVGIGGMSSVDSISEKIIEFLKTDRNNKELSSGSTNKDKNFSNTIRTLPNNVPSNSNKFNNNNNNIDIRSLLNSNPAEKSSNIVININELFSKKDSASTSSDFLLHNLRSPISNPNSLIIKPKWNNSSFKNNDISTNGTPEADYPDFDPSQLLEQTMITEESVKHHDDKLDLVAKPEINEIQANTSVAANDSTSDDYMKYLTKFNMSSPVLNIAKFMALCDNKERSCFTCAICKNDYKNRKSLSRHFKEQHVQGCIYKCDTCGVAYKRREKLIKHNRALHDNCNDSICIE